MKQAILIAALIAATHTCFAQPSAPDNAITYSDTVTVNIPGTDQLLLQILNSTGLKPNFELKEADVLNIQASVSHRKRYILYNPSYITWLNKLTRDKWATMALLAHEVGHHLNGHTIRKGGSSPAVELEADEFAGFVLYKLGATLQQSQEVMKYIAGINASSTHPGRIDRMAAIKKGWDNAALAATIK